MACFCPCIVFGKTRARLRDPGLNSYDTCNSDVRLPNSARPSFSPVRRLILSFMQCAIWSVLSLCGFSCMQVAPFQDYRTVLLYFQGFHALICVPSYQWMSRKEIRARYALKGDAAEDAVWTMCCPVCALVQEEKEVVRRTTGTLPGPPNQSSGYVLQPQMQMQPPHN